MNWVGGKLQRHAKANANKRQKAQRQYFARARQSHHHTAPWLSPPALAHYHDPRPNPSAQSHQLDQLQQRNRFSVPASKPPAHPSRMYMDQNSSDPLENAKRRLLRKTDWTSLAAARPLHIMFQPASEMQRIGRRKRVSKGNNGRHPAGPFNRPLLHDKKTLRALAQGRNPPQQPGSENKDYSIRIGSNLHHTQTTKHASSRPGLPSDPIVLDPTEPRDQKSTAVIEELYLQQSPNLPQDVIQDNLLPLSKARDLSNFDDIKEQSSSSIVRRASVSSNPFTDQHHPRPHSNPPSLGEEASLQAPQADQRANSTHEGESEAHLLPGPLPHQDTDTGAESSGMASHKRTVKPSRSDQELSRPRFTIDHQVLLERRLLQSSSNSLSQVQDESSSLPRPTKETHFPSMHEPGRHETSAVPSSYFSSPLNRSGATRSDVLDDERPPAKRRRTEAVVGSLHGRQPQPRSRIATVSSSNYQEDMPSSKPLLWQGRSGRANQNCIPPKPSQRHPKGQESVGDENEAWMKYVFPHDFDRIQSAFTFQPVPQPSRLSSPESWTDSPFSGHGGAERHGGRQYHPASSRISIPSDVNTSIYRRTADTQVAHQSETDFLSRLSPMEGFLDDRLGPISSYANAATSTRAYISMPSVSMQSDPAAPTDRLAYGSVGDRSQASPTHRRPILPHAQRRLWKPQISDDIFPVSPMSPHTPADLRKISSPLWNSSDPPHTNLSPHPALRSAHFSFGIEVMRPVRDC